jgi:hypothetical protein
MRRTRAVGIACAGLVSIGMGGDLTSSLDPKLMVFQASAVPTPLHLHSAAYGTASSVAQAAGSVAGVIRVAKSGFERAYDEFFTNNTKNVHGLQAMFSLAAVYRTSAGESSTSSICGPKDKAVKLARGNGLFGPSPVLCTSTSVYLGRTITTYILEWQQGTVLELFATVSIGGFTQTDFVALAKQQAVRAEVAELIARQNVAHPPAPGSAPKNHASSPNIA